MASQSKETYHKIINAVITQHNKKIFNSFVFKSSQNKGKTAKIRKIYYLGSGSLKLINFTQHSNFTEREAFKELVLNMGLFLIINNITKLLIKKSAKFR